MRCDEDLPRLRQLFHARSQMRGQPYRGVVHVQIIPNRPDHDFSGVQSHSDVDTAIRSPRDRGVSPDGFLHRQRRVTGPDSMLL
jgi:hypothetical protein